MSKFTKTELSRRYQFSKEEANLVVQFQELVPIVFEYEDRYGNDLDEENPCVINARDLYRQLRPTDADGHHFSDKFVNKYFQMFCKDVDFISVPHLGNAPYEGDISSFSSQKLSALGISFEYKISLDMAKELCMMERTDIGKICREYFILMEKAVKRSRAWALVREPQKQGYKMMCKEKDEFVRRNFNREPDRYDYCQEAELVNMIATGYPSVDVKLMTQNPTNITRDYLSTCYNEYIDYCQKLNTTFLKMDMSFKDRTKMISTMFKANYPNCVVLTGNYSQANKNRDEYIKKVLAK